MITRYGLSVSQDGADWLYAGTAWTLLAAEAVLATYAKRGDTGRWETQARR